MSYTWDVSALPEGIYFVYARLRNGDVSDAVYSGSLVRLIDSDGDGMTDSWETAHGLSSGSSADALLDSDGDGLANLDEYLIGTDPQAADTDGGGEDDHSELSNGRNPMAPADDVVGISLLGVAPGTGDSRGGDTVVVTGSGFQIGAAVVFGETPAASATFIDSTRLLVVTPAHASGSVDVMVLNPGNAGSAGKPGAFVFRCNSVPTAITAIVSGDKLICPESGVSIQAALTGTPPWTLVWSDGFTQSGVAASPATRSVSPNADTTYSITSVSDAYCAGVSSGAAAITLDGNCTMFHTMTPCRVIDTRGPVGDYGGPALSGGAARAFALSGQCGIPASAKAVSLNVTVTGATQTGHLRLFPGGAPLPTSSSINFKAGETRGNNAITRLGAGGTLAIYSGQPIGSTVQVIVDVNGYFE
jgi:hypothetical protein